MAHSRSARGRTRATSPGSSQTRSQRQLRVGEELRHVLAELLARGELRDPHLSGVNLTVTEVRVSPDLKNATAFIVPLGGGDPGPVIVALNHAAGFLRSQLGQAVQLRYTPRLAFQPDTSFDEAARINDILHHPRVAQDVAPDDAPDDVGGDTDEPEDDADGR